jgi:hypothetical protein
VFIVFNVRFGGIPVEAWSSRGENAAHLMPFSGVVSHIRSNLGGGAGNVHWRYCSYFACLGIHLFLCIVSGAVFITSPSLVNFRLVSTSSEAVYFIS